MKDSIRWICGLQRCFKPKWYKKRSRTWRWALVKLKRSWTWCYQKMVSGFFFCTYFLLELLCPLNYKRSTRIDLNWKKGNVNQRSSVEEKKTSTAKEKAVCTYDLLTFGGVACAHLVKNCKKSLKWDFAFLTYHGCSAVVVVFKKKRKAPVHHSRSVVLPWCLMAMVHAFHSNEVWAKITVLQWNVVHFLKRMKQC